MVKGVFHEILLPPLITTHLRGTTGPDTFLISIILYALPFIAMLRADIVLVLAMVTSLDTASHHKLVSLFEATR